jgi:hypothetical protein
MAFASSNGETVIIRRPPRRDNFGDVIPGSASEIPVPDCLVAPGASTEADQNSVQIVANADVYMPEGYQVTGRDQLVIRGDVYEVEGYPQVWLNEGVVISVRLVIG